MRWLFAACLFVVFSGPLATDASADEVFELENGVVIRGYVMRENDDRLTIRLTGFHEPSTVTIERSQIHKRYDAGIRPAPGTVRAPMGGGSVVARVRDADAPGPSARERPLTEPAATVESGTTAASEPRMRDEGFLERFIRVVRVAIPDTVHARITVSLLLVLVLLMLISAGARLADLDGVSLANAAVLSILFGAAAAANVLYYEHLMRADRALWLLPLEAIGWIAAARALLGGSFGRAVLLFAFVAVSLVTVVFATGAVLVAV